MHLISKYTRAISYAILPAVTVLLAASVLLAQFKELGTNSEILPLSSFAVLLSLSGLAFNWCRVSSGFSEEKDLRTIYRAGIDLFLAALLAIVATALAFMQTIWPGAPTGLQYVTLTLHWGFFFLALLLFVIAIFAILATARKIQAERTEA